MRARIAWITVSDSRTEDTDRSGRAGRERIEAAGHEIVDYRIVPDEPEAIRRAVRSGLAREDCQVVLLSGGTGISRRDRTHETVSGLLDTVLDGYGELFRVLSHEQVGSAAMLSRAIGGIAAGRPVFCMPGSPRAVELALERLILPELGHLLAELAR